MNQGINIDLASAIDIYSLYARTALSLPTAELYISNLRIVLRFMGNVQMKDITPADLNKLMAFLKVDYRPNRLGRIATEPIKPCSLATYWRALRSFFKWAEMDLQLPRPDTQLVRPKYVLDEVKPFSKEELSRLIYAAEWTKQFKRDNSKTYRLHRITYLRDIALLKVLIDTGLRLGEISRVQFKDVDLTKGEIVVRPFASSIKSRPRIVCLGNSAKRSLWLYIAKYPKKNGDLLFGMTKKRITAILYAIGKAAGVEHCHPHRFRHTFAIEYLRSSRDPYALQTLLGHTSMDMTKHYIAIVNEDLIRLQGIASPIDNMKL